MLFGDPQLSLGISHWIHHGNDLLFLFPLIPLGFEILPYMTVDLDETLHSYNIAYASAHFFSPLFHVICGVDANVINIFILAFYYCIFKTCFENAFLEVKS